MGKGAALAYFQTPLLVSEWYNNPRRYNSRWDGWALQPECVRDWGDPPHTPTLITAPSQKVTRDRVAMLTLMRTNDAQFLPVHISPDRGWPTPENKDQAAASFPLNHH